MSQATHLSAALLQAPEARPETAAQQASALAFDWRTQLAAPLLGLLLLSVPLIAWDLDFEVAGWLWRWQGEQWLLKNSIWTETVLHQGGRALSQLGFLIVFVLAWRSRTRVELRRSTRPLLYLALAVLLSTAVAALGKRAMTYDCPWDMQAFGGDKVSLAVFERRPPNVADGHCFPAGHASAGYAWVALYFAAAAAGLSRRRQRLLLLGALLAGVTLGFAQQLRGAHFLSHDLWTAAICWFVALALTPMLRQSSR